AAWSIVIVRVYRTCDKLSPNIRGICDALTFWNALPVGRPPWAARVPWTRFRVNWPAFVAWRWEAGPGAGRGPGGPPHKRKFKLYLEASASSGEKMGIGFFQRNSGSLLGALLMLAVSALAQVPTAVLTGVVKDPTGALVPSVTVTAI